LEIDYERQTTLTNVLVYERLSAPPGVANGTWTDLTVPITAPAEIDDRAAKAVRILDLFQQATGRNKKYSVSFRYTPDASGDTVIDARVRYDAIFPKFSGLSPFAIDRSADLGNQAEMTASSIAILARDSASGCFGIFRGASDPGCM